MHLDAAADHVAAAFMHDRLPPPPAAVRRGSARNGRARGRGPDTGVDATGAARKPMSKAERKQQKQVCGWTSMILTFHAVSVTAGTHCAAIVRWTQTSSCTAVCHMLREHAAVRAMQVTCECGYARSS